jgi:hypothetical protein
LGAFECHIVYPWFEFISGKWNGFWLLALGGILLAEKNYGINPGVIGLSMILYLGVVMAYYAVNTFFEIGWWLQTTLSRILFALIPTIALWIGLGLKPKAVLIFLILYFKIPAGTLISRVSPALWPNKPLPMGE